MTPEDLPLVDAEVLAQFLDIGHEVPGGVRAEVDVRLARVRVALAASALIEKDDAVLLGIENAALVRARRAAGAAVQEDRRFAVWIAGCLQ